MAPHHPHLASANGLSSEEARALFLQWGPNTLQEEGGKSLGRMIWEQLTGLMVLVLLGAAGVSVALGDYQDGTVILVIILINTTLGVFQEYRAEKAIAALKRLSSPSVRVERDGRLLTVAARDLVPGDLIFLETGNIVPADCRLVESVNLKIQEAVLTGESVPVEKDAHHTSTPETPLSERLERAYQGTVVSNGRARAHVEKTGMHTELGRIATSVQKVERDPTPLQKKMDQVARRLVFIILAIAAVVFYSGLKRGEDVHLMFLTAVSIAVAAIPESLPAVVAIALALGAQRMLKRHVLVRKLSAVETLGSVTVICTDKTGTLTENRMTVAVLDVAGQRLNLAERHIHGHLVLDEGVDVHPDLASRPSLALLLAGGALCSDASLTPKSHDAREHEAQGDPTEAALVVAAAHFGLWKKELDSAFPREAEEPFDSERKRMSTLHRVSASTGSRDVAQPVHFVKQMLSAVNADSVVFTKGGVESLLEVSRWVWADDHPEPLDDAWKKRIGDAHEHLGHEGMRVLGVSFKVEETRGAKGRPKENDLVFVGLLGMKDPPRPEAKAALAQCRQAGIRVHMITGDHPVTAQTIAQELGMDSGRVMTGREIETLSVEALAEIIEEVPIFARVAPEHKLKIVEALQKRGHIVAMTGDGVNDAPALKKSDIGVAMGRMGTDVSREAADMVLLDDNFASIVAAIHEGRTIYDNIRKFVKYLFTTNSAELAVMLLGPLLGMPLPLLPLQILWINLITDGPPALALGVEPAEEGVMKRPPRSPRESLLSRAMGMHIVWVGSVMAALALLPGYGLWKEGNSSWQTLIFTTLVFSQMTHVLAIHSEKESIFRKGLAPNKPLLYSIMGVLLLQLLILYLPSLEALLKTQPLALPYLGASLLCSLVILVAVENEKWGRRRRGNASA